MDMTSAEGLPRREVRRLVQGPAGAPCCSSSLHGPGHRALDHRLTHAGGCVSADPGGRSAGHSRQSDPAGSVSHDTIRTGSHHRLDVLRGPRCGSTTHPLLGTHPAMEPGAQAGSPVNAPHRSRCRLRAIRPRAVRTTLGRTGGPRPADEHRPSPMAGGRWPGPAPSLENPPTQCPPRREGRVSRRETGVYRQVYA